MLSIVNARATDKALKIDRTLPTLPMLNTLPVLAIERMLPALPMLRILP